MRRHIGVLFLSLGLIIGGPISSATFVPGELLIKTAQPWQSQRSRLQNSARSPDMNLNIKQVKTLVNRSGKKARLSHQKALTTTAPQNPIYIYKLELDPTANILEIAAALQGQNLDGNEILIAQPNYRYKLSYTPTAALGYPTYQRTPLSLIGMEDAWDFTVGSPNIVIAVIDSGIDTDHNEFVGQLWQNPGEIPENSLDDDGNGYIDDIIGYNFVSETATPEDDQGHGTHVSGIIGAKGNILTGVCPGCRIMPLKAADATGELFDSNIIESILYAMDNGASIVNMSFGGNGNSGSLTELVIDVGHSAGLVFVAALGNDSANGDLFYNHTYPAKYTHVLGVSSVDENGNRSGFSNFGSYNFIAAPGGQNLPPSSDIRSTYPNNSYEDLHGTSMSTPHVAGAIGLMRSLKPELTPDEIHSALQLSAQDVGSSGHDVYYGHGILDVHKAILYTIDNLPPFLSDLEVPSSISATMAAHAQAEVHATDNVLLTAVNLHYRHYVQSSPLADWATLPMVATNNNRYQANIPQGPDESTAIHLYVSAHDVNPNNTGYLPANGASNPTIIPYPDDISKPKIAFFNQNNDYIHTEIEATITDNYAVATASISVTVNTGIDEGTFTVAHEALNYADGVLSLSLLETDLAISDTGHIVLAISATDIYDNVATASQTFSKTNQFHILDSEGQTNSFLTYPNPFNPTKEACVFSYSLTQDSQIQIMIYSLAMKEVQKLILPSDASLTGYHEYSWDGKDYSGHILPNGVYLALMIVESNGQQKILKRHLAIKR